MKTYEYKIEDDGIFIRHIPTFLGFKTTGKTEFQKAHLYHDGHEKNVDMYIDMHPTLYFYDDRRAEIGDTAHGTETKFIKLEV